MKTHMIWPITEDLQVVRTLRNAVRYYFSREKIYQILKNSFYLNLGFDDDESAYFQGKDYVLEVIFDSKNVVTDFCFHEPDDEEE